MIDISPKFSTLRYAKAEGILTANSETIKRVTEKTVPKGDVLQVARAAGITAAKNAAAWIRVLSYSSFGLGGYKF
jgi:Molybdenum cofactor biosynthesis enzyme